MKQQIQDTRIIKYFNPETSKNEVHHYKYHILLRENKVSEVYNTAFGTWGHSVEKNSDTFEYFSRKYNK